MIEKRNIITKKSPNDEPVKTAEYKEAITLFDKDITSVTTTVTPAQQATGKQQI